MQKIIFSNKIAKIQGSAIREIFKLLSNEKMISFAGGNPSKQTFPKEEIAQICEKLITDHGDLILQYGETNGWRPFRESLQPFLEKRKISAKFEQILTLAGSSQGIELVSKILLNENDVVLCENPSFLGALQTFKTYGANLFGVEMDHDGMIISDLEEKIIKHKPKFIYTIPNFQNPTGTTLCLQRRQAIIQLSQKYDVFVLEDDPYGELRYCGEAVEPIKALDSNKQSNIIYVGSFSKTISPGLRVGFVVADERIIAKMAIAKQGMDIHTSNLSQAIVDAFLREGKYYSQVAKNCAFYKQSKFAMESAIEKYFPNTIEWIKSDGGLFLWGMLPKNIDAKILFERAVEKNVAFVPGQHFYPEIGANETQKNAIRLNFSMPSIEQINVGIETLGDLIKTY